MKRLVHESEIQQVELLAQNEQLRHLQVNLAESFDRYSNLYDFAPIGYVTLDKEGRILESNVTAATMFGVERQVLLGADLSKFVSPESQDAWFLHRRAVFFGGTKPVCEIEMRRADASRLAVRLEGILFGPDDDRRCRTALIDITELKHAEDALTKLNRTLGELVEEQTAQIRLQAEAIAHLAEGVLIMEGSDWAESKIVFVNDAARRITGYAAQELIGKSRRVLLGPQTDRKTLKRMQRALSAGNSCHAELVQYRKDGGSYDADISVTPLPDPGGSRASFVSIHRDITERKRAEQALRESEQWFRQMADHAPVMIWISGIDKLCTWCNQPWLEFRGRTMEQELGNGWSDRIHPEDLARCLETYATSFDHRLPFTMEYRCRRHDGQWRWILDNGIPLYHENWENRENSGFAGYIGSCVDVTERKQTEQELDQYRKDLRTLAAEVMLAEERERQRLAEDLHDGVGQTLFCARMKVDQLSIPEPDARELITILEEMGRMVNTMTFELSPPVLRKLGLRAAVKSLAREMQQRYALSVQIDDDGQDIPVDERVTLILFRSVRELLINAAKHAQTNQASLSLRRRDYSLQIEIEDRGKGFDLADQSRHVESGHFGLFSIRERLEYAGGAFRIRTAPGHGVTVTLTAPLATADAARSAADRP